MYTAKEAIDEIKEAEKKAADMVSEAEAQAHKAVLDAKLESKEMLFWAQVDAIAHSHEVLLKARAKIAEELDRISKNTQEEKQALDNRAKNNFSRAVNFIKDEFLKIYGNSKA